MSDRPQLIFVYNADSGMFNTLADIGHKIFSPETYDCQLCALTHGYFRERDQWRAFVETLEAECRFMHRDEFHQRWPDTDAVLPAVFRVETSGPVTCLDAASIRDCQHLAELQSAIRERCLGSNPNDTPEEPSP
jgi:hypothetical protein